MRLQDKVCVITGGNSGIGLGVAECFAEAGARGAILGRDGATLATTAKRLGPRFTPVQGDITHPGTLDRLFETTIKEYGTIDVVVACAGGPAGPGTLGAIHELEESAFDAMITLNLKSVFMTVKKALPHLSRGASIILIGSLAAHKGFPGASLYNAAKAGVVILGKTIAGELAGRGVRVNIITPGVVDTAIFGRAGIPDEVANRMKTEFVQKTPIKRIGLPREVGSVAVFLASDESSYLVGTEVVADGGFSIV